MSDNKPFFIRLNLPSGLEESLEGLAKEVLRSQPNNIHLFAAEYYENQLRKRNIEQGLPENKDIFDYSILKSNSQLPYSDDEHLKTQPLEIENISGRNSPQQDANEIDFNDPEYTKAATKIQAGYRGSKDRKDFKNGSDQRTAIQIQMPVQMQDDDDDDDDDGHEDDEETFEDEAEGGPVGTEASHEAMDIDLDDPEVGAAATKIQAGYRGMITRKSMQEKPKAEQAETDLVDPDQEQAATRIQAGYRGMITRKSMKLRQQEPGDNSNVDIALEDPDVEQAATRIQAGFRGMKVRKSNIKLKKKDSIDIDLNDHDVEKAATKIQAGYRGMKVRKSPRNLKENDVNTEELPMVDGDAEDRAATRIQAGYRGMKTRRNLITSQETQGQDDIDIDLEDPDVERAASKIQAGYKGFKTRQGLRITRNQSNDNEIEEAEPDARTIESEEPKAENGEVEEAEFQTENTGQDEVDVDLTDPDVEMAATKIQAGYRGMRTRKEFQNNHANKSREVIDIDLDDLEVQQAASRIQAGYKGMKTRRHLKNRSVDEIDIDLTDPEVERAATKIQAGYKGMRTRKQTKFVKEPEETKDLEDEVDANPETEVAATKIQAGYRGHQARKDYSQRKEILDNRKKIPKSLDEFNRNIENDIIDIDLSDPNVEHAATKIQAGYKGMRTRKTLGKKEAPSEPIEESHSHQMDEDEAATRIQAGFRGMKTRNKIHDVTKDRIPISDPNIDLTDPEVEKAATKIQAGYKGMRTRRGLNGAKTTEESHSNEDVVVVEEGENMDEMGEAATKIQSGYRGMRARKDLKNRLGDKEEPHDDDEDLEKTPSEEDLNHLQPSNELEQGEIDAVASANLVDQHPNDDTNDMDLEDPDFENAATRIQAGFRGMKVRQNRRGQLKQSPEDEIADIIDDKEIEGATTKIQAGFRGMQARKNLQIRATPQTHKVADEADDDVVDIDLGDPDVQKAASRIQAGYKGLKVRKDMRTSKPQHNNVPTIAQDEEEINNYDPDDEEMAVAATRIQAGFKGMKTRKEMTMRRGRRVGMFGQYDREDDINSSVQNGDQPDLEISATHVAAAGAIPFDMHPSAHQGHESEDDSPKKKAKGGREDSAGSERMEETFINVGEESPSKMMRQESHLASSLDNSSTSLKKTRNPLPPIEIYHYQGSHNSQKVMVYLYERGIEFSDYHVDFQRNEQLSKWFLELNPKGQVPVMKFDNQVISDSTRIIHHLEAQVPTDLYQPLVPNSHETHLYQQYVYFTALLDQVRNLTLKNKFDTF
ncbi:hypothetical protein TCAL_07880 [Tigriopus californicus]|uniref:GST N-terminal domain-containing protein n=1 Tax=Tigriopus californicus TaxID=6832 RepID=A0A553N8F5_TIGCA|nr:hypothetical protein TCAL_07880 [Tigriopus californicus]